MKDEETDQLLARVSALEYLLEIGYATWMAQMSTTELMEFDRQFDQRLRTTWPLAVEPFGSLSERNPEILREAQAISARFWKKAREKERDIRLARKTA
jgi:hypothetical protein